jgi:hypothetical protein
MQIKEVDDKTKEIIHKNSLLSKSLNAHFEKWRPELVLNIKSKAAPPVRDFRLKEEDNE